MVPVGITDLVGAVGGAEEAIGGGLVRTRDPITLPKTAPNHTRDRREEPLRNFIFCEWDGLIHDRPTITKETIS